MPRETFRAQPGSSDDELELIWPLGDDGHVAICCAAHSLSGEMVAVGGRALLDAETTDRLIRALQRARREAFGTPPPTASIVEILEAGDRRTDDGAGGIILPSDVRINGVSVYTTGGVRVHEMDLQCREYATVTLTLPARRITVAAEGDLAATAAAG